MCAKPASHAGQEAAAIPRRISPMLALPSPMPADAKAYGFEFKWDGIRAILYWDGRRLKIESRNLRDITFRYPELAALPQALAKPAVLDGEIVALDSRGMVSFNALQYRMNLSDERAVAAQVGRVRIQYMLFDALHLGGQDLMHLPYRRRRALLEELALEGPNWKTPPYHIGHGEAMLQAARQHGMEGILAKRLDSLYEPGRRSGAWLKIKLTLRQEFVVGGYVLGQSALQGRLGALIVGYYDDAGRLIYAGKVGTGFTDAARDMLQQALIERSSDRSPFDTPVPLKDPRFARPELVAEIEFAEWTPTGILRHPSFKGLRYDKDAPQVVRET